MKKFFFDLLKQLDKLTGIKQYEKLQTTADPAKEVSELIEILCRVCAQYSYIPEKYQQAIISTSVVNDLEFIGLNARIVNKWLYMNRERFIGTGNQYEEKEPEAPPLTGEAREKRAQEVLDIIAKCDTNFTQSSNDQLRNYFDKLYKKTGTEAPPRISGPEEIFAKKMHIEYLKANYDPRTKEKLPNWMPEEQWLLEQGIS